MGDDVLFLRAYEGDRSVLVPHGQVDDFPGASLLIWCRCVVSIMTRASGPDARGREPGPASLPAGRRRLVC